ncbi:MAG: hypothetical protein QXP55_00925 [Nitrososphaerales archaeon]
MISNILGFTWEPKAVEETLPLPFFLSDSYKNASGPLLGQI